MASMAILNNKLPVQVFFQSKRLSFRKVDPLITVEYDGKIFKLTWVQAVQLIESISVCNGWILKERVIMHRCKQFKQYKRAA
jgi:hypothetical protein